jgi:hypothetical protein
MVWAFQWWINYVRIKRDLGKGGRFAYPADPLAAYVNSIIVETLVNKT